MTNKKKAPIGSLVSYFGANTNDFLYIENTINKIKNSELDIWDKNMQIDILKNLTSTECTYLINMCVQILEEEWDEFSIVTGYSLSQLKELKYFINNYSEMLNK